MQDLSIFKSFQKVKDSNHLRVNGKAVIYTRVSTKEQAENNASLETQLKYCKELAQKKEIEVLEHFGGTYESAKSDERKQFQKMLSFVKRRKDVGYIIVYSYDRFSRTGANGAYISDQLKKQGIVTVSATQEVDTMTTAGSFQQNLYYMFSQFDNELRRDKCVSGMKEKIRKGYYIGPLPFGYTNLNPGNGKTPEYIVNDQGKLLRKAFIMKANLSLANAEIVKIFKKKGLKITEKTLSKYLRNPFYCGLIISPLLPDEIVVGKQQPLVTHEMFLKINNILHTRPEGRVYNSEDEYLPLKTFIKSFDCKTPYTGYLVRAKNLYYYKNRRKGSKENRSAKKLHQTFVEFLSDYQLKDEKLLKPLKEIITRKFIELNKESIEDAKRVKSDIEKIQKRLDRIEERYVYEEISKVQYDKFKQKLEAERRVFDKESEGFKFNSSNLKKAVDKALGFAINLPSLWELGDIQTKRAIQYMVFPEGICYDFKNHRVRTFRVNSIFSAIASISGDMSSNKKENYHNNYDNSLKVESEGFEPSSKQAMLLLSTCVVSV
jgi:site-specific DNA recombinase